MSLKSLLNGLYARPFKPSLSLPARRLRDGRPQGGTVAVPEPTATGHAPFGSWQTWYRVTGDLRSGATPLVVLHGGPGAAHNYTLRMARLAEQGRAVIHYDQLG